ncbi:hypothetical protein PAXRUDRAFT_25860 [Paxillus rubicundulus Ve08.2h10]|uniref:Uncharacterized protein n=1 Tax=Paxillus rubicundulus Ve08.2h10 TaxID=930991 RepID=A0A0D0E255_9AGAM|nr:hypothetical protein PAXRUDRAFT_25860 [Paxillus rubicundulus Ve08.2h10]
MPSATASTMEFSHIQTSEISKYRELRVRVSLGGNIQESQESTVDAGVHMWRELFSLQVRCSHNANSNSLCEIHVLAKKRRFLCCAGRYKAIRKTRLQSVEQLVMRSDNGVVRLPLYDSTRTNGNGVIMGSVIFLIADTYAPKDSLNYSSARDSVSCKDGSGEVYPRSSSPEAVPSEKLSLVASESEVSTQASLPPRPMAPTPATSPPSASPTHYPPYVPPQPPPPALPSHGSFHQENLKPTSQLPRFDCLSSPPKSGVNRTPVDIETHGDAAMRPKYVSSPENFSRELVTAASSLICEEDMLAPPPQVPWEIGSFSPVICKAPEDIASEGSASVWLPVPPHATEPALRTLPIPPEVSEPTTLPQISITLARSSRSSSPLAPSCESDVAVKRPNVHVNTGPATQALNVGSTLSPGFVDEPSSYSHSAPSVSPQPVTATTNTSSSGLSPFSRASLGTVATTPAASAASECPRDGLTSAPECTAKQRKERPTIDTSCVGPGGQVRKYRNGSVPPVHVPVKLRNASLDLPRRTEQERFEPNPSMYSIAPSISPRHFRNGGDIRCPSSQRPGSRQGFAPGSHAPSIRREALEYDEGQICLDTANLGDQEVATFLKEVDAALSAVANCSPAVAADGRAFLSVPSANSRLASRHQSRKPSSQQLRADLSAAVRSHDNEAAARTGFSLVARSHATTHPAVVPSRIGSPLSGQVDTVPRLFVSQLDMTSSSKPASPSRGRSQVPSFPVPQRVSPRPSSRHELAVEWAPPALVSASSRTKEPIQLVPVAGPYNGNVDGNETTTEGIKLANPHGILTSLT